MVMRAAGDCSAALLPPDDLRLPPPDPDPEPRRRPPPPPDPRPLPPPEPRPRLLPPLREPPRPRGLGPSAGGRGPETPVGWSS